MGKTILYDYHKKLNANIIDFHGTLLPVMYSSIQEEHNSVRTNMGIFDVSHMGNLEIIYPSKSEAIAHLNNLLANDYSKIVQGKCIYSTMLNNNGTVIDDLIVMSLSDTNYHIIVNASNIDKDFNWIKEQTKNDSIIISNVSDKNAIIAVQGPAVFDFFEKNFDFNLPKLKSFHITKALYKNKEVLFSTTGYTGEKGYEIVVPNDIAVDLFDEIITKGKNYNLLPCGLGARDTLRLESGLPLYGQDLSDKYSPLQSMIAWSVKMNKDNFIGKDKLTNQDKFKDIMIGFEMEERGIPRTDMEILDENDNKVGIVTSGSYAPSLKKSIGLAYILPEYKDKKIFLKGRRKNLSIKVVKLPFYNKK